MIEKLDEYQEESAKTMKEMSKEDADKYCSMQLASETGELSGMIAKHYYHGKVFDVENCKEELSDILWFISNLARVNGFKMSEIATYNIEKLRKRHGEKYNQSHYTGQNDSIVR